MKIECPKGIVRISLDTTILQVIWGMQISVVHDRINVSPWNLIMVVQFNLVEFDIISCPAISYFIIHMEMTTI